MSGFRDDVLCILRDNTMLHGEARGLVVGSGNGAKQLLEYLIGKKYPVSSTLIKPMFRFDYIVLDTFRNDLPEVMDAFSSVEMGGIIIIDVTNIRDLLRPHYASVFADFTATKLKYVDNRAYLVIHKGVDYGN